MISVIIPLYNKEKCIERTIDSVLAQTYTDFELLVIDDGSTDNSSAIVKQKRDSRVRYVYKRNGGVSTARNFGVKESKGEWILFLDADDALEESCLKNLFDASRLYPECNVIMGGFYVSEVKRTVYRRCRVGVIKNPIKSLWLRDIYLRPGNALINKNVFDEIKFDERISYNEDYAFSLNLLRNNNVAGINVPVMVYEKRNSSLSTITRISPKDFALYLNEYIISDKYIRRIIFEQYLYSLDRSITTPVYYDRLYKEYNTRFNILERLRLFIFYKLRNLRDRFKTFG